MTAFNAASAKSFEAEHRGDLASVIALQKLIKFNGGGESGGEGGDALSILA